MGSQISKMKLLAVFCALLATVTCYRSYHGHSVLRTETLSVSKSQLLRDYHVETNLDFWREAAPGQSADVMVPARMMKTVTDWLKTHNIQFEVMVEDVQSLIEETNPKNASSRSKGKMDWEDYYPHEDLNAFIQGLADANDFASIINIGQSYEGRDMNVLAVTKAGPGKPNVFIEAGIHAREWISPAVATFIFRELVEDNAEHPEYLDNINWYFLPSANPDVMLTPLILTDCGERQDHLRAGVAMELIPIETGTFTGEKLVSVLILALKSSLENNLSLRLRQATFVTLLKHWTQFQYSLNVFILTLSYGSGLLAMIMEHTQKIEKSWNS